MAGNCDHPRWYRLQWFRTVTARCAYSCWPLGCWLWCSPAPEKSQKDHWAMVPKVVRNGPGHWCTKKSLVPFVVSNSPNSYPNINTNPLIYQPVDLSPSISTVDSITPTEEYGRYRRSIRFHLRRITVDCWSSINHRDNLWSILSTTHLECCFEVMYLYVGSVFRLWNGYSYNYYDHYCYHTLVFFFCAWFWLSRNQSTEWVQIFGHLRILDQYSEDKCKAP